MIRPRSRVLLTVLALLLAPFVVAPSATAAGSVTAAYALTGEWDGNFQAAYTITNGTAATISSWRVEFDLATGTDITSSWDSVISRSGNHVVANNASWNAPLAAGQSATFGFIAHGPARPANCRVNGGLCAGGAGDTSAPTAPGNARVTATSTSTVSLAWNASTDNVGVTGYDVYSGGAVLITTDGTTGTVGGLSPGTAYTFTVKAHDAAGNSSPASNTVSATTVSGPAGSLVPVAPYVDRGAWPTPSLTAMATAGNLRSFTLGFVTGSGGCKASWFGAYDPRTAWGKDQIDAIRARGGDVKISFGGAAGSELAQVCSSAQATAAEYQAVVDAYQLRYLDVDIEGGAVADPASIARRSQALAILQSNRPALKISLTLPVLPEGLDANGFAVLKSARDNGINLDLVNIMAMDYNRSSGNYGDFAVQAAQSTFNQIKSLWPALTDAQAWLKVGVTPMLGKNDDGGTFNQTHSTQLVNFARTKHLGMLSFWEMTRDRNACNGSLVNCTNVPQTPYQFSQIFAAYTG
ncbi:cellulose binding domain-containing protein [Kribbella sp. NPDC058245]|uniref:cellulose binding domain-containing protein n=1 Tax=Kribbella sp. NPDC058245 TaxID=3346399 RepID=UPI0036E3296E